MRFDWYQATIEEPPVWIRQALEQVAEGQVVLVDSKPLNGYAHCDRMYQDGDPLLDLNYGGYQEWPHLVSRGASADEAARMIRQIAPDHLLARADVCEDLQAPGWFDEAFKVMRDLGIERKVKMRRAGDWDSESPSRTFYLGSPSSDVQVRHYEKGKQLRAEYPDAAAEIPEDWCRLEVQVRPSKREGKRLMARAQTEEFWGCARWTRELANQLLGVNAPRLRVGTARRQFQELDRSLYQLARQYGNLMRQMRQVHGSWSAVGELLGRMLEIPEPEPLDWSKLDR